MAIFHVSAAVISKGTSPGGAVGFARYLERTDQDHATQHRRYLERDGHDADRDLVASGSACLPAWANDAAHFWLMADRYERKNGVIARTYEIALPRELSDQGRLDLADDIRAALFARYPHTWAVHCPEARTTERGATEQRENQQPHMHLMLSPRREDAPSARTPQQWFARAASTGRDPLTGGVRKDPVWERKATLQGIRYEVAVLTNAALEREGHAVAVSHASLRAQGHDRRPERVHSRVDAVLLKKYGWEIPVHLPQHQQDQLRAMHDRWKATLATREAITRDLRGWENAMNVLAWDLQKQRDGLRDISREAVLDHVRDRFWRHDHSQVRTQERDASLVRAIDREYARTGRERPQAHEHSKERGPERARLGLTFGHSLRDDMQGGTHVQLQEREYAS
jgi:MobA/MobL family protein